MFILGMLVVMMFVVNSFWSLVVNLSLVKFIFVFLGKFLKLMVNKLGMLDFVKLEIVFFKDFVMMFCSFLFGIYEFMFFFCNDDMVWLFVEVLFVNMLFLVNMILMIDSEVIMDNFMKLYVFFFMY